MRDWSASLVFWTVEPERPLTPHDPFHIWLSTSNRSSGTAVANCTIPVDLTTFSMHSRQDGAWNAAVSFISPIFHNTTIVNLDHGLALTCDDFQTSRSNKNVLCFLNRTHVLGEERYYGRRMSIKPVNSDTLGVPLRDSIDNRSSLRLRLVDVITMDTLTSSDELSDYVVCISV
jgi:hypothetical protein